MIKQRQISQTKQQFSNINKSKYITLSPYLNQLDRRKRFKSVNKTRSNIKHESSQKSFRIKQQKSSTSLHGKILSYNQRSKSNLCQKQSLDQSGEIINKQKKTLSKQLPKGKEVSNGLMAKLAKIKAGTTTSSQMKDKRKINFASNRNAEISINSQLSKTVDNNFYSGGNEEIIFLLNKQQYTQSNRNKGLPSFSQFEQEKEDFLNHRDNKINRKKSNEKNNEFFKDLYSKIQSNKKNEKIEKGPIVFQRSAHKYAMTGTSKQKYNDERVNKNKSPKQIQKIDYKKLGYTDFESHKKTIYQQQPKDLDNTYNVIKKNKNFRRNKYQALHSSVTSNHNEKSINLSQQSNQPFKSQNNLKLDLEKKQSNASLNKEMDDLAQRQMKRFYRQKRGKQIQKSIQKSTQKYLGQQNYRPLKSKNDIEIYLSTITNPLKHKQSRESTLNSSNKQNSIYISFNKQDYKNMKPDGLHLSNKKSIAKNKSNQKTLNFLEYDFDFAPQQNFNQIRQIQNASSQEDQINFNHDKILNNFENQRKKVQIDFFNKQTINVEWSQDEVIN